MATFPHDIWDDVPLRYNDNCMLSEVDDKQPKPSCLRVGMRGEQIPGWPSSSTRYEVSYLDVK